MLPMLTSFGKQPFNTCDEPMTGMSTSIRRAKRTCYGAALEQFAYVRATSVVNALELLAAHGDKARILSGGQSLMPAMNLRLISSRQKGVSPKTVSIYLSEDPQADWLTCQRKIYSGRWIDQWKGTVVVRYW